jgi:hypothetical protein
LLVFLAGTTHVIGLRNTGNRVDNPSLAIFVHNEIDLVLLGSLNTDVRGQRNCFLALLFLQFDAANQLIYSIKVHGGLAERMQGDSRKFIPVPTALNESSLNHFDERIYRYCNQPSSS